MENLRGILLMIASMAGFAMEDMFIKRVSTVLPTGQILICIGLAGGAVFAAVATAQGAKVFSRDALLPPVLMRHAGEIVGTAGFVTALSLAPLSTVSAILQALPLAVTLGAALVLGEAVGWRRWTAICVGFAGVLLVVRPGMAGFQPTALFAILAVIGLAARDLATRRVPTRVSTMQLSAYAFFAVVPAGAFLLLLDGSWSPVDGSAAVHLAGAVLFGIAGYYAITAAMRVGEVSVVTPFRYSRLVFAVIIAATVFGERPDAATYAGAALIIGSGLYTLLRERRVARARRRGLSSPGPVA